MKQTSHHLALRGLGFVTDFTQLLVYCTSLCGVSFDYREKIVQAAGAWHGSINKS